jgi:chemotaxis protein methyltransferase CheR
LNIRRPVPDLQGESAGMDISKKRNNEMTLAKAQENALYRFDAADSTDPGHGSRFRHAACSLSEEDFARFGLLVQNCCGIKMPPQKKNMMEARLRKRLRALGLGDFEEYAEYLFSDRGRREELVHFLDVMTTNKTDFFRESAHFDFLVDIALPKLIHSYGVGINKKLRVWSAGCSTGEEPYTLAMVLSEFAERVPGLDFSILATDISTQVIEKGKRGIYDGSKVGEAISEDLKRKYLLRSKDSARNLVRIVPELRSKVTFRRINFMEEDFGIREPIDIIFCRNVIIYFDRSTQEKLLHRLSSHIFPGRYLFMGHSETLSGMDLPLSQVAPSVYRKK